MAELTNKFHVKQDGTVKECTTYSTTDEATPLAVNGGNYLEIKNNNVVSYLGLWPVNSTTGARHTPLVVKKGDVEYYVETSVKNTMTVTITQSSHQTITVTAGGTAHTSTFTALYGTTYTVSVTGDTGWTAGAPSSASGTITNDMTITAAAATYKSFALGLAATTNQTITLKYKNKKSDGTFESEVTKTSTGSAQSFTVGYGTTWTATVAGATGWTPGSLSPGASGTVTAATTVSAGTATYKSFTLGLAATTNQTITLKYKNKKSDGTFENEVTKTSSSSAQNVTVGYGTTWTATIAGATGWTPGTLSPGASGTVTAATTVTAGAATYKTFTLSFPAQTNQTITLKYKNKKSDGTFESEVTKTSSSSAQSFTVGYGTTWTATITGATGWTPGALSPGSSGTVTAATTVTAGAATYKTFTLSFPAQSNQTITLKYKNKKSDGTFEDEVTKTSSSSAQSFTVGYGTTWTASIAGATGYNAGTLSPGTSGTVTAAVTVTAGAAALKTFVLTLAAQSNQTITLKYKNRNSANTDYETEVTLTSSSSNQTATVRYGTTWTATIAGATGYNAGALSPGSSGTVTAATTVTADAASLKTYTLTLAAQSNQTITLKYTEPGGSEQTKTSSSSNQNFTVKHGTTWTATIAGATGYNAGALSPGSSGTVTAAVTVTAGAASLKTYALGLAATTNQTITLKYTEPGGSEQTKTSTSSAQSFTVKHGTTWTATIAGATGWTPGALSPGSSGTVTAAVTVTAGAATYKSFTLSLPAQSNQTITLKYKNKKSDGTFESEVTKTSSSSAQSFTVGYGTTWTATIAGATGWNAGALSPGASGTVTAATAVTAGAATLKTFTLQLAATSNQTITLKYKNRNSTNTGYETEVTKTSSSSAQNFTVRYNTTWTATVAGATGYNAGTLSPGSSGTVTAATTVSAGTATLKTYTLTLAATTNQTITLVYTEPGGSAQTKTSSSSNQNFTVKHGTTWTASVTGSPGYDAGSLTPGTSGTVTGNVTISVSNSALQYYDLTLAATTNQTITLNYTEPGGSQQTKTSTGSAQIVSVAYGTTWTASVAGATGWTPGALSPGSSGTVSAATTVSAAAATFKTFALGLAATTNQTITLVYTNKKSDGTSDSAVTKTSTSSAQSFTVGYGTTWTATIAGATGWNAGALSPGASGTVTAATTVSAGAATLKTFSLILKGQSNQTITLKYKNRNSTNTDYETEVTKTSTGSDQTFTVRYNTTWTATIAGATGYNAGALSPGSSGTVTATTTVTAGAASLKTYALGLAAQSNQTITLKYTEPGGSEQTKTSSSSAQSFTVKHGTTWTATIAGATGYNPGTLSPGSSGTVTAAVTVTASAASLKTYALGLAATSNQTITLKYTEPGGSEQTKTSTSSAQSFTVKHGTTWTATIAGATGYNPGTLSPGSSGTVTAAVTVTAGAASLKTYALGLAATTNQTITLVYTEPGGSAQTKTSSSSAQSFTVKHGTTWTATIAGAAGYDAGALSPGSSGTVSAAITVTAGAATLHTYYIHIPATANQRFYIEYHHTEPDWNSLYGAEGIYSEGENNSILTGYGIYTSTAHDLPVYYNHIFYISVYGNTGWNAGQLTITPSISKTTSDITVTVTAATRKTYTLTLAGTSGQKIDVTYQQPDDSSSTNVQSTSSDQTFTVQYGTTWTASSYIPEYDTPQLLPPIPQYTGVPVAFYTFFSTAPNMIEEPDGTIWIEIFHHNHPADNKFSSTDDFTSCIGTPTSNRFFAVDVLSNLNKYELLLVQKITSDETSTEEKYRWIQYARPTTAYFGEVDVTDIVKITSSGEATYSTSGSKYGGLYKAVDTAAEKTYLTANNGSETTWWAALGSWTAYGDGIPGYNNQTITTGYIKLYVRIDNISEAYKYNPGALSPGSSGTITGNTTISASARALKTFTLTKDSTNGSTNQTFTVEYKARAEDGTIPEEYSTLSSGSIVLRYGSWWHATATGATGFDPGPIYNSGGAHCFFTSDITAAIEPATKKQYKITLTQKANETVTIHYKNRSESSATYETEDWQTTTSSVTLRHNSIYYVTIAGSTYYSAGTVTSPGTSSSPNTLTAAVTIDFTAATHITYVLTLKATTNQTISTYYKNHSGSALASSWSSAWTSGSSDKTKSLGKGSQYYSTIAGATGYNPGTITNPGTSSSPNTLNAAKSISATAATGKLYYLRFDNDYVAAKYTNSSGSGIHAPKQINCGQVVYVYPEHSNHTVDHWNLYKNSSASGSVWLTKTTRNFTFTMPASQVYIQLIRPNPDCGSSSGEGD